MHMADALVTPEVGLTMYVAAAGVTAYSVYKIRKEEDFTRKIPLMGVVGAFVFAAQMINFSIPLTGSSGHIGGGVLLAAVLGPEAGFISLLSILLVQCLFFGDGGLIALGCNAINMAFFSCFIGYNLIYKRIVLKRFNKKRIMIGSILGVVAGLQLGAFSVVLETLSSGITKLPFNTFVLFMQPIHLAIGLVEGVATGFVLNFLYENRPDILERCNERNNTKVSRKKIALVFLALALVVGGGVSLLASSNPDGLEWSIFKTSGEEELENESAIHTMAANVQDKTALLPDYSLKTESEFNSTFGTSIAGVIGVIVTILIIVGIGFGVRKNTKHIKDKVHE